MMKKMAVGKLMKMWRNADIDPDTEIQFRSAYAGFVGKNSLSISDLDPAFKRLALKMIKHLKSIGSFTTKKRASVKKREDVVEGGNSEEKEETDNLLSMFRTKKRIIKKINSILKSSRLHKQEKKMVLTSVIGSLRERAVIYK